MVSHKSKVKLHVTFVFMYLLDRIINGIKMPHFKQVSYSDVLFLPIDLSLWLQWQEVR